MFSQSRSGTRKRMHMYRPHIDHLPLFLLLLPDAHVDQGKYIKESHCNIDGDGEISESLRRGCCPPAKVPFLPAEYRRASAQSDDQDFHGPRAQRLPINRSRPNVPR
jgi:hypothetical protein